MKEEERQKVARKEEARRSTAQPSDGGSTNHSYSASHHTILQWVPRSHWTKHRRERTTAAGGPLGNEAWVRKGIPDWLCLAAVRGTVQGHPGAQWRHQPIINVLCLVASGACRRWRSESAGARSDGTCSHHPSKALGHFGMTLSLSVYANIARDP